MGKKHLVPMSCEFFEKNIDSFSSVQLCTVQFSSVQLSLVKFNGKNYTRFGI